MKRSAAWGLVVLAVWLNGCGQGSGASREAGQPARDKEKKVYIDARVLEKMWMSAPVLRVPESVLYDTVRDVIYVSNIDGRPDAHDGKGFIALLGPEGKVRRREWVTGLDAPKGLGFFGERLYVSDINVLVEIDIPTAKVVKRYEASEAVFLNDVAVDAEGRVYVSDMGASAVYRLENGRFSLWVKDPRLNGPNGLLAEKGRLLAGLKDRIVSIDPVSGEIRDYILHTGSIDGLEADGHGGYLISDWRGHVYRVDTTGQKELWLDTTPAGMQAADIDVVAGRSLLLVPTFRDNRVAAYRIKRK